MYSQCKLWHTNTKFITKSTWRCFFTNDISTSTHLQTLHFEDIAKMYIVIFAKEGVEPKDG
jgi:hypothetical protein